MKKKRKARPWWQRPKTLRTLGMWAGALAVIAAGAAWFAVSMGKENEEEYLVEAAPAFELPTVDGTYVSSDHLGDHNVLLYFNEGMG